ncbi:MAG TPA: SH3 domain-containing protein [Bacteroidales bacterium]|jgi:peptidoglycan hydrolase-like protein with peptidoglycan-binding domain|nr:SH3 domain-containing protein [Bacteroidales bacterium]
MNKNEKVIMRNIIYAVETGGNVYGNKNYRAFVEAYTNSSIEHAITIGAAQWMGVNAQKLLKRIREKDQASFKSLDTEGIAYDLDNKSWDKYQVKKSSAKGKCIINIIDSAQGRACQDELVVEDIQVYINEVAKMGITDMDAKMMCANFAHQGGYGATRRVLAKSKTPYTLDNIYKASKSDTGNQVGTYATRQKMVYDSLKKYLPNTDKITSEDAINKLLEIASNEVGYLEKKSKANLDSKTANAGSGNYTKYWRDIDPGQHTQPWCACFVTWCMMNAFGQKTTEKMLKHYPFINCDRLGKLHSLYKEPKRGDIVLYYNGTRFYHTGLVESVPSSSKIITIEGNTSDSSGIVSEGEGVFRKTRTIGSSTRFVRPDYSMVTDVNGGFNEGGSSENDSGWERTGTGTCTGNGVRVRATPGGRILGSLNKGNTFEVDGSKSGQWVKIKVSGIGIGWMHQDYVSYSGTGVGSDGVKLAQRTLNNTFDAGIEVDGIWGPASKLAYTRALQKSLNKVYGTSLIVDGIWGNNTANAISIHNQKCGDNNLVVAVLQIGLYANNISLNGGIDHFFGPSTESGLKTYQSRNKLSVDGIAGKATFEALTGGTSSPSNSSSWNSTAYSTGQGVYVRKTPAGEIIGSLNKGASFKVDGTKVGEWIRINVTGLGIGYMHKDYVSSYTSSGLSSNIKVAQSALNNLFKSGITADGDWGPASKTALIKAIQSSLNSTYRTKLTIDGVYGPATSTAISANNQKKGNNNLVVACLQIGLHAHNISLSAGVDKIFGVSTEQGVKAFQISNGLTTDGIAGNDTFSRIVK